MQVTSIRLGSIVLGGVAVAISASGPLGARDGCCSSLGNSESLKGKVYLPSSEAYRARLDSYWSAGAALPSWCMVQPSTAQDTSAAIQILVANDCPFGIRGGGHGAFALSNSVREGVTIDFGNMNATTWDPHTRLASIEPGGHWGGVYEALAHHGVVVAGGRVGNVGTGGFLMGGGISYHAASHGMACDNVANFEVVLADGSIVNANATSRPDLWQALKGGGGNLGLVTRFDMHSIDYPDPGKPEIWGGILAYNLEASPAIVDAVVQFTDNVHRDENSSSIAFWAYNPRLTGGPVAAVAVENTLGRARPPAFDGYYTLDGLVHEDTQLDTMSAVTADLGAVQRSGYRNIWITATLKNDARVLRYAVEKSFELNAELEKVAPWHRSDLSTYCILQPITRSIVEKGIAKGGNVMGLEKYTADGNGILFLISVSLKGEEEEKLANPIVEAYIDDVVENAQRLGLSWDWRYLNYAHKSQRVIPTFGEEAVAKLQAASARYDPRGVFQRLRMSGFKISGNESWGE